MQFLNIVLLGGTGFVGRHLMRRLLADGHRLTLVSRQLPVSDSLPRQVAHRVGDVTKPETFDTVMHGTDAVINLVGAVRLPDAAAYFALHETGARHVACVCREAGVGQLIHFSALGVDERAPSSADRSKAVGERAVRDAFPEAVILRPSLLYGDDDHILTLFEAVSRSLPVIPLIGADTRFQPLHVEDLGDAIGRLLVTHDGRAQLYQAGGPEVLDLREIVLHLCRSLGRRRLVLPLPERLALGMAALFEHLPHAPFNRDQVLLMKTDKIEQPGLATLRDLGVHPRRLAEWLRHRS